jgi:hypothetical protein
MVHKISFAQEQEGILKEFMLKQFRSFKMGECLS